MISSSTSPQTLIKSAGQQASPVILNYEDLVTGTVSGDDIATAFGGDGLGILFVRGVPGYVDARIDLLPLALKFSKLDEAIQVHQCLLREAYLETIWRNEMIYRPIFQ